MEEKLIFLKTSDIKPYQNNAKLHPQEQINAIIKSIQEFGFTNPVLVDENHNCIGGHGRIMACEQMGMEQVPCRVIKGLSDAQKRALILADNKITEMGTWDEELLKVELEQLEDLEIDMDDFGFIQITDVNIDELFEDQEEAIKDKKVKTIVCPHCGKEFEA